MPKQYAKGIFLAVLAAILYAISAPLSKLMLDYMPSTLMAGFLYLGAGVGMGAVALVRKCTGSQTKEERLSRLELPYTIAMILLDIAAPICLLVGLSTITAAHASLLNNFEIVATAIVARLAFGEKISSRLWTAIVFITLSCIALSFEGVDSLRFSVGSLFVLLACVCWGVENNCTRKISSKDPMEIVLLKGIFSGTGALVIGLCVGQRVTAVWSVFAVLAIGFVAYGMSIFTYVYAQRLLGAARTSAYYALSPFIGTSLSLVIFRSLPGVAYWVGLALMVVGAVLASSDEPIWKKRKGRSI